MGTPGCQAHARCAWARSPGPFRPARDRSTGQSRRPPARPLTRPDTAPATGRRARVASRVQSGRPAGPAVPPAASATTSRTTTGPPAIDVLIDRPGGALRCRPGIGPITSPSTSSAPLGGTPIQACNTNAEPAVLQVHGSAGLRHQEDLGDALVCVHHCTGLCAPGRGESQRCGAGIAARWSQIEEGRRAALLPHISRSAAWRLWPARWAERRIRKMTALHSFVCSEPPDVQGAARQVRILTHLTPHSATWRVACSLVRPPMAAPSLNPLASPRGWRTSKSPRRAGVAHVAGNARQASASPAGA